MAPDSRIAVVGLGGVFPGARDPDQFWNNIATAHDAAREVPPGRWLIDPDSGFDPGIAVPDKVYSRRGCFIEDFALSFDGIDLDPELVTELDPMFHLALHASRDTLRSVAGRVDRQRAGAIFGNIALPTEASSRIARNILGRTLNERLGLTWHRPADVHPWNRWVAGLPGAVVARGLGLGLGAYTLDAACASSLYAVRLAAAELAAHRADFMIAGGVSRPDCLYTQMGFAQLRALSRSGRCAPFDANGDGLVVGEGAGMVALKRLDDALDHGDTIHAVLTGFGLSNDLDGSLLAPSTEGQLRAMRPVYARSQSRPQEIDLIECHATGTPVGDGVELRSLRALWGDSGWNRGQCVIGGVKSNVGHLLTGAGAAGLIKVLLALRHRILPPTANFVSASAEAEIESSPFTVLTHQRDWERRDDRTPRRAAVNAFGFGGINAHITLEEFLEPAAAGTKPKSQRPATTPLAIAITGIAARVADLTTIDEVAGRLLGFTSPPPPRPPRRWFGVEQSRWFAASNHRNVVGHWLDDIEIPLGRFRIPPRELEETLPQQTLMLVVADEAVRLAGWSDGPRPDAGVFIGIELDLNTTNFSFRWSRLSDGAATANAGSPALNANRTMGALGGIVASRIARELQIGGPSFTISAEECSGLRALEAAVRALTRGEINRAVVGAVDLADVRAVLTEARELPGEGAAAIVLKRLADAERDGDHIHAVIRGLGVASGGNIGIGDTGAAAATRATALARAEAGNPETPIDYVEFQTSDGQVTSAIAVDAPPRTLHSTSHTAIGHCGAASGFLALVKATLALDRRTLPIPAANADSGSQSSSRPQPWLRNRAEGPRRAEVSVSSFAGDHVQVVLEEAPERQPQIHEITSPDTARLFALGAGSIAEMGARLREFHQATKSGDRLANLSAHFGIDRVAITTPLALAIVARDPAELLTELDRLDGDPLRADAERSFFAAEPIGHGAPIAFLYPGSGSHYRGQGRELALAFPEVVAQQDRENLYLRDQLAPDSAWSRGARGDLPRAPLDLIFSQVALGTLATDVMKSLGVTPGTVIGYSLGESAGLFSTRAWTDRDMMLTRMRQSTLFRSDLVPPYNAARLTWGLPHDAHISWVAGVVDRDAVTVRQVIARHQRTYLLIRNTPGECVIGGERRAIDAVVRELDAEWHPLDGVPTVHCPIAKTVEAAYRELHLLPTTAPRGIRFMSAVSATPCPLTRESAADSITRQALEGFDFPAVIERAYADGTRVFLEMGPGASTTRMVANILGGRPHRARAVAHAAESEPLAALRALALVVSERAPLSCASRPAEASELITAAAPRRSLTIRLGNAPFELPSAPSLSPSPTPAFTSTALNAFAPLVQSIERTSETRANAHRAYLTLDQDLGQTLSSAIAFQMALVEQLARAEVDDQPPLEVNPPPWLDRPGCMEIAIGSIAKVLGPEFAEVDSFPTRVRLPDQPLMLVDRVVAIEGQPRSLSHGRVVTEHDVRADAWYLDGGRIPTCIAVEAGQADLLLSGYLGIDFVTRGLAVYRLLDAVVTFHDQLPAPGTTIRYDIAIERFFTQGDTHLFRFRFDGTVGGRPFITMREGCAGFFTQAELDSGKGVVHTELNRRHLPGKTTPDFTPLTPLSRETFDEDRLAALRAGDLVSAFGAAFTGLPLKHPATLPGGQMKLIDRVVELDPVGGRYGLGLIRAEADIHPDDWFLTCHFVDDMVMPGTLMYECCLHTLRVFLLRLGWVAETDSVSYQPVIGVPGRLKCRGQVIASTTRAAYEIVIKEIGYGPEPYAIADALMYADGRAVVEMTDMSLRLVGQSREQLEASWGTQARAVSKPAIYDNSRILAFAIGNPSEAFGEPYRIFDRDRVIARLPGPPYQFLDRVTSVSGEPWKMVAGVEVEAQYDVPPDAWYFAAERQPTMPFAVLLEVALQPCGWLAAYVGSALTSPIDLSFRNLGGSGSLRRQVTPATGTLTVRVRLTRVANSAGMIIQNYDFAVFDQSGEVYKGDTYFGFFSKQALSEQVGLRDVDRHQPNVAAGAGPFPQTSPFPDDRLRMVDRIAQRESGGGPAKLGFVRGAIDVDPDAWFFAAHFHQDPVWPGSLGLESFLQLLKFEAHERWGSTRFRLATDHVHTWVYRGQVLPSDARVQVDAVLTALDHQRHVVTADGLLEVDSRIIYQMKGFQLDAGDDA